MASMTNYLETELLDEALGITSFTKPTADYLALHDASPTDTGSLADETSASGYAREEITSVMNATSSPSGFADNDTAIEFGPAGADWGTITHATICDAATTGNALFWAALDVAKDVDNGDSLQIGIGQLSVTFA